MKKGLTIRSSSVVLAAIAASGCTRDISHVAGEEEGRTAQAIVGGASDDNGDDSNIVVALDPAPGTTNLGCSGVLITSTVVLTARTCLSASRSGTRPTVRVGSKRSTAKTYRATDAHMMAANADDPPTVDAARDLALVFLDPKKPVLEGVRITHQAFPQPDPTYSSRAPDGSYEYPNVTVAGWSPLDQHGNVRSNGDVRQRLVSGPLRLLNHTYDGHPDGGIGFWVRDRAVVPGQLSDGDLGSPLYISKSDGTRQVIGIATMMGATRMQISSCPAVASCDVWADLGGSEWADWLSNELKTAPTAKWSAAHPIGHDWYVGEVDYTGACQNAADADCDHVYDWNLNGLPDAVGAVIAVGRTRRDNCSEWFNPDQADVDDDQVGDICDSCPKHADSTQHNTSVTWTNKVNGDVVPIKTRYANDDETVHAKYPGDACLEKVVTQVAHTPDVADGDPQSTRRLGFSKEKIARASNVLYANGQSPTFKDRTWGHTRATVCECMVQNCDIRGGRCEAHSPQHTEPGRAWQAMTMADVTADAATRPSLTLPGGEGLIPTEFGGILDTHYQEWSWRYWVDDLKNLPAPHYAKTPRTVFRGIGSFWVKNYADKKTRPRPSPGEITAAHTGSDRMTFTVIDLREELDPGPPRPLPDVPVLVDPDPAGCIVCGRFTLIDIDPRTNPDPIIVSPLQPPVSARSLVPAEIVDRLKAPGAQIVTAARGSSAPLKLAVIESGSGDVSSYVEANGRQSILHSVRSATSAPAQHQQHILALGSRSVFDFGIAAEGVRTSHVRVQTPSVGLDETRSFAGGVSLGTVIAAVYRAESDDLFVVDVGAGSDAAELRLVQLNSQLDVRVVQSWQSPGTWLAYGMHANSDGSLTLTAATEDAFAVVGLAFEANTGVRSFLAVEGRGRLGRAAEIGDGQIGLAYIDADQGVRATAVSIEALARGETVDGGRVRKAITPTLGALL